MLRGMLDFKIQDMQTEIRTYIERFARSGMEYRTGGDRDEADRIRVLELAGVFDLKGSILDFGCGTATFTPYLRRAFDNVIGLDVAYTNIKIAKHLDSGSHYICGSGLNAPFQADSFNAVLCCGVLHHFPDILEPLKEINRILKRDGILFVIEPNAWNPVSYIDYLITQFKKGPGYYGKHHVFGYLYMKRKLKEGGFIVLKKQGLHFARPAGKGIWSLAKLLEPYCESLPVINMLGGALLVTAKKVAQNVEVKQVDYQKGEFK